MHEARTIEAERDRFQPRARLWAAIATSLALHCLAMTLWFFAVPAYRQATAPQPLLAYLRPMPEAPTVQQAASQPEQPADSTPGSVARAFPTETEAMPLTESPRFASPPDFEPLESLPTTGPTRLRLRIHVSSQGKLKRIEIVESSLVPPEFVASVFEQLEATRYLPGSSEGRPVDSSFDILIAANPASAPAGETAAPENRRTSGKAHEPE